MLDADLSRLADLAGTIVQELDLHRTQAGAAELTFRRSAGLNYAQEAYLARLGVSLCAVRISLLFEADRCISKKIG